MRKKIAVILVLSLGIGLVLGSGIRVYADDTSEAILKILIKKGLVTPDEVAQMKEEIAGVKPRAPEGLEGRVAKLEEDLNKVPKIGNFLGGDMKVSGYIQTRYTAGPGKKVVNTLDVNNAKLTISGHAVPEVAYKLEAGLHQSANVLYDAYLTGEYFPKAKITIGQFKVPYSEEFITSSSSIKTADRALFQGTLTDEYSQGLMVDGDILNNLYYALGGITGQSRSPTTNDNEAKDAIGRLVYSPFKAAGAKILQDLKVGSAIQYGRQPRSGNSEGGRLRNLVMLKYGYKGFTLQSEYAHQKQEQIPGVSDVNSDGWYALLAYKFPFQFFKYSTHLEPVFKLEQYDPDKDLSDNRQDMYTLGLTWYLNKYVYLMGNYQWRIEQNNTSNDRFILQSQVKF